MDDEEEKNKQSFLEQVGTTFGQLFVISMYQARATLNLAKAIEKDPSSAPELKSAAKDSLEVIDLLIEKLEEAVGDGTITSIKDFVGRAKDE